MSKRTRKESTNTAVTTAPVVASSSTGSKKSKKEAVAEEEDHDYASKQYWDQRYVDKEIEHEWYYSFGLLEPIFTAARSFSTTDKVLELGCGDRPLIQDFAKFEISGDCLYAIDFSDAVIADLKKNHSKEKIHFLSMDARKLTFANDFFDFIVEKGTIDAMLSTKKVQDGIRNAHHVVKEAIRVMQRNGTFVLVSHIRVNSDEFEVLMDEIIVPALETKFGVNWKIQAHSVKQEGDEETGESKYGTVYVITSLPKKATRNSENKLGNVSFEVLEYGDSDEAEEEEEGEEWVCMPCGK